MSTTTRLYSGQAGPSELMPGRFRTLQYQPSPGEPWYHVLFGHVPRFQMDFILRPELPCRKFRPQHFAHLGQQIKFLAPAGGATFAAAIANLSSNDTQHIAGRGGLAVIVSTRVADLRDHAQRESPVFAHALIAIDEPLEAERFSAATESFVKRVLDDGLPWYQGYYLSGQSDNFERVYGYIRSLRDLPLPSNPDFDGAVHLVNDEPPPYNQILIDCREVEHSKIMRLLAKLGVILYRTTIKWTTITTGCEEFEPKLYHGEDYSVAIRLCCGPITSSEIERQVSAAGPGTRVLSCSFVEIPNSEEEIGAWLFGLPRHRQTVPRMQATPSSFETKEQAVVSAEDQTEIMTEVALGAILTADADVPLEDAAHQPLRETQVPDDDAHEIPRQVRSLDRRPVWPLILCGLIGVMTGSVGAWLGGRQDLWRADAHKIGTSSRRIGSSQNGSQSDQAALPLRPADEVADEKFEAKRLLVAEIRERTEPMAASGLATYQRASRAADERPTPAWRMLQAESKEFKTRLEQMNHIATGLDEGHSVYKMKHLVDSYCHVLTTFEQVKRIETKYQLGGSAAPGQPR